MWTYVIVLVTQAGLTSEKNSTKLLIALEPEAASVFCRSLAVNSFACDSTEDLTFLSGERILIIDAGGDYYDKIVKLCEQRCMYQTLDLSV